MMNQRRQPREEDKQALAVVQPPRLPMPAQAAEEGFTPGMWKALVDAVFPSAKSVDGVMLAINYAKARNLDIFKRVVHVVPMWNSALGREVETVWPGIGELRTTASRTGQHAGNDDCQFGPSRSRQFKDRRTRSGRNGQNDSVQEAECTIEDFPEWAQITVYKMVAGQRVAFVGPKVRFLETFSGTKGLNVPNARWERAPYQMLEKCAEAAALRRAFPDELGDQWAAEEMDGKTLDLDATEYAEVPEQEQKPEPEKKPERKKRETAEKPAGHQWGPGEMDEFMKFFEDGCARVPTIDGLDDELTKYATNIAALPKAERKRFDGWVEAARTRLAGAEGERDPGVDEGAAGDDERPEEADEAKFDRYLETLERWARDAKTPVDVNSLRSREKTAIGQLPGMRRAYADKMLDVAMDVAKNGGDFDEKLAPHRPAGNAAPPGSESTAAEEVQ